MDRLTRKTMALALLTAACGGAQKGVEGDVHEGECRQNVDCPSGQVCGESRGHLRAEDGSIVGDSVGHFCAPAWDEDEH